MAATGAPVRFPDRYENPRLLATGGMGQVYCAADAVLGRAVAIKLLGDRYASDPTVQARFEREAVAAARLSSDPNTVTIFDVGEYEGRPFIVMEYLQGGSIGEVLREEGAQPPERALDWLRQAAAALDQAHAQRVVHRDVKPANLLLTDSGRVKVADFGVASAAGLDPLTQTGTIIGTAGYLSPEQAQGQPATSASDRYALAVVAFELLSGSRPFQCDEAPAEEAAAHVHTPVPSISARRSDLPPELDSVFARALAKTPSERFPICADFVAALYSAFARATEKTRIMHSRLVAEGIPTRRPVSRQEAARPVGRASLLVLIGFLFLVAGVLAAILLAQAGSNSRSGSVLGVTVTQKADTVLRTVGQQLSRPPTTASPVSRASPAASTSSPSSTALQGYARMQRGDYVGALPLLEQAAAQLQGTGSLAEAHNDYNLAVSLASTQGCSDHVLQLLSASQAIQGSQQAITDLRDACTRPPRPAGKAKGHHHKKHDE